MSGLRAGIRFHHQRIIIVICFFHPSSQKSVRSLSWVDYTNIWIIHKYTWMSRCSLSIQRLITQVACNLWFPFITILKKLLFVIEKLLQEGTWVQRKVKTSALNSTSCHLSSFCGELKVRSLNNCIDRTSLLAEPTVDALGHIDVIPAIIHEF